MPEDKMNNKMADVVAAAAEVSEEAAVKVAAAIDAIISDPPVGTVLRHPATGDVAVRVHQYAEFYWRLYSLDDRTWIETEPLVGWEELFAPAAAVITSAEEAPAPKTKK